MRTCNNAFYKRNPDAPACPIRDYTNPRPLQYSVGKAAREAFFRVLAVEDDTIKVLSYSPGPVDTAMHDVIAKEYVLIKLLLPHFFVFSLISFFSQIIRRRNPGGVLADHLVEP
ncbi:hypothetical protein Y032_0037g3521 [Ancylostoma ceylanicum]|uniref:Uncharacterized protein n=1 Tax=Ancylostoma ceylanicum TaxID=53326 RepID=A0A016UJ81_9BILA|nr:hypothetical protein Y032_0037g3521 [Ancylostoma ceylanicum]